MRNLFDQEQWQRRGENDGRLASLEARIVALEADTGWITPTLLNSWVSYDATYGPPGYRKKNGVVYLKGMVKNGSTSAIIFVLPAGFRPGGVSNTPVRLFSIQANDTENRIDIDGTNGNVTAAPGDATWTSLNGISFIAEN